MTTHSNGSIYTNTSGGVVRLSDTGSQLGIGGLGGNALGIAEDPLTGELYYVGSTNDIRRVTPALGQVGGVFANNGGFTDGILWNADGSLLYTSDRTQNTLDIFTRGGVLDASIALGHEPTSAAVSLGGFVLTNNTNGTVSRVNTDGTVQLFASGGFRGDLGLVGADGCWYISQAGTRYNNGTISGENSIVRICADAGGGFVPAPGLSQNVPEPGTLALLGFGLAGLAATRRRRQ